MLLIKNIKKLVQVEENPCRWIAGKNMAQLNCIDNAFLLVDDGKIVDFGKSKDLNIKTVDVDKITVVDAVERMVFPSFCDSHTHLVYAGSREIEYIDKIRGLSYAEIAKRGGGILNSAKLLHNTDEDELLEQSLKRINEIASYGTGAVEIKSGYGLSTEDEIKMLKVIKRLQKMTSLTIKSTFLGAHAVPQQYIGKREKYIDLIINEMIPQIADEKLADFIDVFCDKGFFTVEETKKILIAGAKYGLQAKIHANELAASGGIQIGVECGALSVDHLECTGDDEINCLLGSKTMPTLLPGAAFFLGMNYPPARKMIEAGLPVALASDYNPGSSPSGDMKFILSLACIKLKMLPEEAINATTINSAYAMNLSETHGNIARGKTANIFITKPVPTCEFLPYAYTTKLVDTVILNGEIIKFTVD
ncbi:MAG: imidazolonepropionase [Prevotellaceae bacterium]|jgi:imidazolonepropionase|nr:imidazolonepropionase [Prevotellaceae bacterium]